MLVLGVFLLGVLVLEHSQNSSAIIAAACCG